MRIRTGQKRKSAVFQRLTEHLYLLNSSPSSIPIFSFFVHQAEHIALIIKQVTISEVAKRHVAEVARNHFESNDVIVVPVIE